MLYIDDFNTIKILCHIQEKHKDKHERRKMADMGTDINNRRQKKRWRATRICQTEPSIAHAEVPDTTQVCQTESSIKARNR
jgi:hypothetical protein